MTNGLRSLRTKSSDATDYL
jgi:hypothetical protein